MNVVFYAEGIFIGFIHGVVVTYAYCVIRRKKRK